jgi:hypothetical protein
MDSRFGYKIIDTFSLDDLNFVWHNSPHYCRRSSEILPLGPNF